MRFSLSSAAIVAFCGCATVLAFAAPVAALERGSSDPKLTTAIVGNHALQSGCGGCARKVEWIGSSYARVTVDAAAWNRLPKGRRTAFARSALAAASAVYLEEWAAGDIYQRISIVDRNGVALMSFQP